MRQNKLADLLSRMELEQFHMYHKAFMASLKKRRHLDTSGKFLVPEWGQEWGRAPGALLGGSSRASRMCSRWDVVVVRVGPEPVTLPATLQSVRRYWDRPSRLVMLLTLPYLMIMSCNVIFGLLLELALRAAVLVGFFGLFCKDNLSVVGKNVQKEVQVVPLTYTGLAKGIERLAMAVELQLEACAGHLLRRGGATVAKRLEVDLMYIKPQSEIATASRGSSFRGHGVGRSSFAVSA
ncbi:hypothetical protein CYMTET_38714 [Cymbomonas tetramitiformis]|uniref:Uncharacterized protein n=1 Tax=Cymbomonas tetramitiformis TaxID=36881 RepID=A0AAE0CBH0_9CHLO|nr:hypothetical protein CYMTET_38718 [Cymbomonas tetramitiformis]KAK3251972.1 hypothetical protein CYMTET_38714 [Cymbomonas tetramitiformis]